MVSEERMTWLLGRDRPTRVIPAGLVRNPVREVPDEHHTPLHVLERNPADDHEQAVAEHVNHKLQYPRADEKKFPHHDPDHDHEVLVSASPGERLEDHLPKMSIWIRAAKPREEDAADSGPKPLNLVNLIEEAVAQVTKSSLEKLSENVGDDPPSNLAQLLGDAAGDVRDAATKALARGLGALVDADVIKSEDLDAIHPESLIEDLLTEPSDEDEDPDGGAIATTILHPPGVDRVHFSVKIQG